MKIDKWRERTVSEVAESAGPVAEMLIDSAVRTVGAANDIGTPHGYCRFLRALYEELPENLDRKQICDTLCQKMLGTILEW